MKIAILTVIINRQSGARAPLEIAKALKNQGHQVVIFAYDQQLEPEAKKELEEMEVRIKTLPAQLFTFLKLTRLLRKKKFDVINFHGTLPFFLAALLSGIPIIRSYHGSQLDAWNDRRFPQKPRLIDRLINHLANQVIILLEKFILKNSTLVLGISQYTCQELKKLFSLDTDYVYHGAKPASFKKSVRKKKKEIIILSVSRIVPYKGFHHLVRVFNQLKKQLPQIKLVIIGSSPNEGYLAYLRKIAGPGVEFKINVSDKDLVKAYQEADIYASFDYYMFFGMPILEAASFALPTVAIKRCAAGEMIKQAQTGFLAKNEAEFKQYLTKLIQNSGLRKKLGQQAQKWADIFTWKRSGKQYEKHFEKAKKISFKTGPLSLTKILLLGTLLRLVFINRHTFWFDEVFSYLLASRPFLSLLRATAADNNPWLYYLLLKTWMLISQEVWFLRALSLIFGILSIFLVHRISKKLTNLKIASLTTMLFALSPLHIYFSIETRMYTLLVLESLLLCWLFLKLTETKKKAYLILIALLGILSLHTHYFSGLILLALNLAFLVQRKKLKKLLFPWIISQTIILLAIIPWFVFASRYPSPGCWCFPPLIGLPAMFASFTIGGMGVVTLKDFVFYGPRLPLVFFSILSVVAFLAFLRGLWVLRKKVKQNLTLFIFFFVPVLIISLVSLFTPLFSPRSLIIVSPFYYLFIAIGIFSLKNNHLRKLLIFTLLTLFAVTLIFQFFDPFFFGPPLEKAAELIKENYQKEEAILHSSPMTFYPFRYFHRFSYPEFQVIPSGLSSRTISEIGGYKKPIEEIIPNYSKVWWVNISYWVSQEEVNRVRQILNQDFILDFKKHDNNIEIYHYTRY